jgi:hypothetical protein
MTTELEKLTTGGAAFLVTFVVLFGGVQVLARSKSKGVDFFYTAGFWKAAAEYLPWALLQQVIALAPWAVADLTDPVKYAAAAAVFACFYHLPNFELMFLTGLFALFIYPFYFGGLISIFHVAALHSIGGASAKFLGVDLRAWWAYWRSRKGAANV